MKSQVQMFPEAGTVKQSAGSATVKILPPADVLDTLKASDPVAAVILDPWYNRGVGGSRPDYHEWLSTVIDAASKIAEHGEW